MDTSGGMELAYGAAARAARTAEVRMMGSRKECERLEKVACSLRGHERG